MICYMPPELNNRMPPTPTSDVWSLFLNVCVLDDCVTTGLGPTTGFSGRLSTEWVPFMDCLNPDPGGRPLARDVMAAVAKLRL